MKRFIICIIADTIIIGLITHFFRSINIFDMMIGVVLTGINTLIYAFNTEND